MYTLCVLVGHLKALQVPLTCNAEDLVRDAASTSAQVWAQQQQQQQQQQHEQDQQQEERQGSRLSSKQQHVYAACPVALGSLVTTRSFGQNGPLPEAFSSDAFGSAVASSPGQGQGGLHASSVHG